MTTIRSYWLSLEASSRRLRGSKHKWAPPATENEIADLEDYIGTEIPTQLKQSLMVHNGDLALGFLDCEGIQNEHEIQFEVFDDKVNQENVEGKQDAAIKQMYWNSMWIPFVKDKVDNLYCVDMDPTPQGREGQVILWDHNGDCKLISKDFKGFMKLLTNRFSTSRVPFDTIQRVKRTDSGLASSW